MDIQTRKSLTRNLSPIRAWAFALGTSIGWGSLVVTANTYLAQAGPVGSVIGLVLGAIIMLVVCQNYAYMMSCYPDAGGVYSFCRECFGYDHGFLAAWFLMLTYLAMLWANATSLPLFARYFFGDIFRFGRMYELFGYGVYLAEAHIVTNDVVISLGCTDYRPGEDRSLRELFERADERMYENKKHLKKLGAVTRL